MKHEKKGLLPPRYMSTKNASANKFMFNTKGRPENERYSLYDKSLSPNRAPTKGTLIPMQAQTEPLSLQQVLAKNGFVMIEPISVTKEKEIEVVHKR